MPGLWVGDIGMRRVRKVLELSELSRRMHCKSRRLPSSGENPGEIRQPDLLTPCIFLQL